MRFPIQTTVKKLRFPIKRTIKKVRFLIKSSIKKLRFPIESIDTFSFCGALLLSFVAIRQLVLSDKITTFTQGYKSLW